MSPKWTIRQRLNSFWRSGECLFQSARSGSTGSEISRRKCLVLVSKITLSAVIVLRGRLQNIASPLFQSPRFEGKVEPSSPEALRSQITPLDQFFVRSHHREPNLPLVEWTVHVEGRVSHPFEATFSDLILGPLTKLEAILECSGNDARGQLVSNGNWEGVPMSYFLQQAVPDPSADRVLLQGADVGPLFADSKPSRYMRIVPLYKCLAPETLVAFRLNDRLLPYRNGFPARALLPGHYGMDSVKWLERIVVLNPGDHPEAFHASEMEKLYNRVVIDAGTGELKKSPVSEIVVKSLIVSPVDGARLTSGVSVVSGYAWSGRHLVSSVSVTTDGGKIWKVAELDSTPKLFTWVKWRYNWDASEGEYVLMSRALDAAGNLQPITRDPNRKDGYELNWCATVRCSVR